MVQPTIILNFTTNFQSLCYDPYSIVTKLRLREVEFEVRGKFQRRNSQTLSKNTVYAVT